MQALRQVVLVSVLAMLAAGCTRGPDEAGLARDVQARLDTLFGRQVLKLDAVKRQGSAPYNAASDGGRQAIVYYNARLRFTADYDPSDWEGLSPQVIAAALGATDDGVIGLKAGPNEPGDELRVYGSLVYAKAGDAWHATAPYVSAPKQTGAVTGAIGPRSPASELIERLSQMVDKNPRLRGAQSDIVAEELNRALQNIELRLDAGGGVVIASGPAGGTYAQFVGSLLSQVRATQPVTVAVANTEGSVANAFMIDSGKARFGLVQSDVAAAAVTGAGLFAGTGPLRHLRAVASLFPEPVHVIVRADAGIDRVAQLAGRRIAVGSPGSGTRHTALRVLAAHGLAAGSYTDAESKDPVTALAGLTEGRLDAVIEVASAPWAALSDAANRLPLKLLVLDPAVVAELSSSAPGLVPLSIAARTYPGQEAEIRTTSATALLVASDLVSMTTVANAIDFVFAGSGSAGRGVNAARLSKQRALDGITIPLHEGAALYFAQDGRTGPDGTGLGSKPD